MCAVIGALIGLAATYYCSVEKCGGRVEGGGVVVVWSENCKKGIGDVVVVVVVVDVELRGINYQDLVSVIYQ
jgi:hypothetical protein